MRRARYKCIRSGKAKYIQGDLDDKGWICLSVQWIRWAKRYLNKAYRRRYKYNREEQLS